jgi:enediyne biosynthesis protein E4
MGTSTLRSESCSWLKVKPFRLWSTLTRMEDRISSFTNGANIEALRKDSPTYLNRLYRNDGNGVFTDVTIASGLAGTGYDDIGAAVGDYGNDGFPDLFVAGVHRNALYHNNCDGTFTDVSAKAGISRQDAAAGAPWSVAAAWVDVNGDGLLDLFIVNYLQWDFKTEPLCAYHNISDYCAPSFYKGLPDQLFLNNGNGTFRDASEEWGLRSLVGKGMGVGVADYDHDGKLDLFVTNDGYYNYLFHNTGRRFDEVAMQSGVALPEDGNFISGMGLDFRDIDNDGYPDVAFAAVANQTFPVFKNEGEKEFLEVTGTSGMRAASLLRSGFGVGIYHFDNDGWKDIFVSGGHVLSLMTLGTNVDEHNFVFQNPGRSGKWHALGNEAGSDSVAPARRRGCAFGDFDGDSRVDIVVTGIGKQAELWMNRSRVIGLTCNWKAHAAIAMESVRASSFKARAVFNLAT